MTTTGSYLSTGKGDNGTTSIGGHRIPKDDVKVVAMSYFDRCDPAICDASIGQKSQVVQSFIDTVLAFQYEIKGMMHKTDFQVTEEMVEPHIQYLENFLATIRIPEVKFFIKPIPKNVRIMRATTEIRTAETHIASLEGCDGLKKYINRLSDCFHALALHVLTPKELMCSNVKFTLPDTSVTFTDNPLLFGLTVCLTVAYVWICYQFFS